MAVRLDNAAVRAAAGTEMYQAAEDLLAADRIGTIVDVGGGAAGSVEDGDDDGGDPAYEVWVGVVSGALTAECDCGAAGTDSDDLCVHAVALTLAAIQDGFAWASAATPPSQAPIDADVRRLVEIASTLPPQRLAALVGEHAAIDRRLAARLLADARRSAPDALNG